MLIAENTVISMRRNIEQPKLNYILGKEGLSERAVFKKNKIRKQFEKY